MLGVVIPAFKAGRFLVEAATSVLNQACVDRLLVVEDACPEKCGDLLLPMIGQFGSRLRVIRLCENGGQYRAINSGITLLRTQGCDFLGVLDADDRAHAQRFQLSLSAFAARPELMAVSGQRQLIDEQGNTKPGVDGQDYPENPSDLLGRRYGQAMIMATSTYRSEVFGRIGGFDCTWGGSDTQFVMRMHYANLPMRFMREVLGDYRIHPGQVTKSMHLDEARKAYHQKAGGEWLYWKLLKARDRLRIHHLRTPLEIAPWLPIGPRPTE